ncbi:MAG TPA: patatin-like phospholipase family protein [Burkholderiaceae bacterium]|nr:patatin-like phospholipase family protein [Burkholderiaceae bacterium]
MNPPNARSSAVAARPARGRRSRIGLALAGGGPLGAIYEIGALAALSEALRGIDFTDADVYVGVSAGAFIAAGLANGVTPHQMSRLFIEGERSDDRFDPALLLRPALREYGRRVASLPALLAGALWRYALRPGNALEAVQRLGRALPTGLFDGDQVDRYLARIFAQPGRSNDFRRLRHKLFLVATDLDSGEAVAFGAPGFDHVPISRAVQASAALPGVFPPVPIDGRYFVDGALKKTLHASIALEEGVDLLICVNPLVPYDAGPHSAARDRARGLDNLVDGGLPVVLAQTFRSIIHSRLDAGMERYKTAYSDTDIVLFQPDRADADMFFTNLFSYSSRRRLCEHAYQKTRQELWLRRHELTPKLARHGIELDTAVLRDGRLTLVRGLRRQRAWLPAAGATTVRELAHTLDDLEHWLAAVAGAG